MTHEIMICEGTPQYTLTECLSVYTRLERHFNSLLFQIDRVDKFSTTSPSLDLPAGTIHMLHMHITYQFPSGFDLPIATNRKGQEPNAPKLRELSPEGYADFGGNNLERGAICTRAAADVTLLSGC